MEDKAGVRPGEKDVDSLIACLCGPHPSYAASCDATSPSSCSTVETGWSRRRASITSLDEAHCPAQAEVPADRLCPSGVPNEAMAPEAPTAGWLPHFAEEQACFDVPPDSNMGVAPTECATGRATITNSPAPIKSEIVTSDGLPRLATNAVRYPEKDIGRKGEICLDISPYSRRAAERRTFSLLNPFSHSEPFAACAPKGGPESEILRLATLNEREIHVPNYRERQYTSVKYDRLINRGSSTLRLVDEEHDGPRG